MEHLMVPVTSGIIKDFHERILPENKASDSKNITFEKGRFRTRWGYVQVGAELYDGNPTDGGGITAIIDYEKLQNKTRYIVITTTSDAYLYSQETGAYSLITKVYNSGSVTVTATGLVALTATGATWDSTTIDGNRLEIMFNSSDENAEPTTNYYGSAGDGLSTKWWKVSALQSATSLQLSTAPGDAVATACNYVIRDCWSGDTDDVHSWAFPYDTAASDKVLVVANGIEEVRKWTGTGNFAWMDVNADIAKQVNYFGAVGSEHLILSNTVESGISFQQRLKHTSAGRIDTWGTRNAYYDLLIDNSDIKGLHELKGRIYVYKRDSITELWADPAGDNDDPFNFIQNKVRFVGTHSTRTVANTGNFHIFLGSDNNVYAYDGVNLSNIGEEISRDIDANIDRDYITRSFAAHMKEENLYCLFIPTASDGTGFPAKAYVFNYIEKTWTIWEFNDKATAFGKYRKQSTVLWSDWTVNSPGDADNPGTANAWSTKQMRWSDLKTVESKDRFLFGDSDGKVYEFEERYYDDNGTAIEAQLVTRDFPLNDAKHTSRVLELEVGFNKLKDPITATAKQSIVDIECSPDYGDNYSTAAQVDEDWTGISGDYKERIFNFLERGKACRFRVTNSAGTPLSLEILKIGFNPSQGKER